MVCALITPGTAADARDAYLLGLTESELLRLMQEGLDRHPSVMLAGVAALAVPVVALASAVSRVAARWRRRRSAISAPPKETLVAHRSAWIEIPGRQLRHIAVGELVSIGNSDDCDLAIADPSLGGTCAIIQRTPECEFVLFDVSAGETRLAVNGAPSGRRRLSNGDRIEIGNAAYVVFRTGEAAPLPMSARGA
jgi:hypothetical protein